MITVEHIAWQVGDPLAVASWYGKHFGFTLQRSGGPPSLAHFLADASGKVVIEIYNNPKVSVPDYFSIDPLHLHLAFAVADPAAERNRLLHAGATIHEDLTLTPAGDQLVMLRDPWGFAIQLVKRQTPMHPL